MIKRNLNGSSLFFPQDEKISFDEPTHTYRVENIGVMTPVSTVIGRFFRAFDAEYWSMRKCNNDVLAAAKLREEWAAKGAMSSQAGTHLHRQIERYVNGETDFEPRCVVSFNGEYVHREECVGISREWGFFKRFDQDVDYSPFRTEWCVYDVEARMAGTIDLLCAREDGSYEMYDWKRSCKVDPDECNRWASGLNGLEHLTDTAYSHYCLQQNLYRYMLERNYGLKVKRMNLVVLHPTLESYRIVPVPIMDREVAIIIDLMRRGLCRIY